MTLAAWGRVEEAMPPAARGALLPLEELVRALGSRDAGWEGSGIGAFMRLWQGQIAAQEGRAADASKYFVSLEQRTRLGWYAVLLQARFHGGAGDAPAAAREYRRFLELWSEAPEDHPFVKEAREAAGA